MAVVYFEGSHLPRARHLNASVSLGSAVRRRHRVQYHLALLRQLSFYDHFCILRALLLGRRRRRSRSEALTTLRAIITAERNTPLSREASSDKCSSVLCQHCTVFSPFVIPPSFMLLEFTYSPVKLMLFAMIVLMDCIAHKFLKRSILNVSTNRNKMLLNF